MATQPLDGYEDLIGRLPAVRPFAARLSRTAGPPPRVIAEMKRSAPGAGLLRQSYVPRQIALGYARVGAAAISVATEPDQFGGDLSHLVEVRAAHLPVLRNDFLVTPYQVAESRASGADAVLLIAGMLPGPPLGIMLHAARRYGIEAMVEISDETELAAALDSGARVVSVSGRNPETMRADPAALLELRKKVPSDVTAVARGGIGAREDIDRLLDGEFDAFLIGEALMREHDPGDALWKIMQPA